MKFTRRGFLKGCVAGTAGITLARVLGEIVSALPTEEKLNILWLSCEDISPRIGAYGDHLARTPNIDKLADEGMRFTNVFTTSGVCAPCRCGIITGMYQTSIGGHHMRTTHKAPGLPTPYSAVPPPYVKTFTEYLRAAGYYCTNSAKTDYQFSVPITAWDECSGQAHWRDRKKGQPFFAVFNFTTTHESGTWLEKFANLHLKHVGKHNVPRGNYEELPEKRELVTNPSEVEVPPYYPDTPVIREDLARQYDLISFMDKQVGEMLRQLQEDGLADNTIVFFWSDHGDGFPRAKRWIYDSGIHIPLVIRWPGVLEPGSVNDNLISSVDFGPTVLSLAGVEIPAHMQGRAFMGSQAGSPREYIFAARDRMDESYDMVRAVRDKKYKYIRNYYPEKPYVLRIPYRNRKPTMQELLRLNEEGKLKGPQRLWFRKNRPVEELYNIEADPHEINNLAKDPSCQSVLERMRTRLDRWMEETNDMGAIPEEIMVEKMWPDRKQPKTAKPVFSPDGGEFTEPVTVTIYCATQGASIAYTTEKGKNPHWQLYTGPIKLTDSTTLRTKATRYGYKESEETATDFTISRQ